MSESYRVYLAVPGRSYCWGTVTGVVNSTRNHQALPFSGGYMFSGAEDFNMHWTDAHNLYEQGEVTHFAMLHGDITPDPRVKWLDILLDVMDAKCASLVSAVSPIKDARGVTSSGIADLNDPWRPYRRFTVREIRHELPEDFNNVIAGYPDRPLLHNTGLWVCDLRRPVFHAAKPDGQLDLYFQFPTQATRDEDGRWRHRRESEDWLFSRELWERGVKDTWITSRINVQHDGFARWGTYSDWGSYVDGDEDTADKWRAELDAKPLRMLQILEFELGSKCNLGHLHPLCPNLHPERYGMLDVSRELDDETIIRTATQAYAEMGFTGMVGWIYYNEPLMQADRMFHLMREIKWRNPQARYILWTNGMLIPEDCEPYRQFSEIVVTNYNESSRRGFERLKARGIASKLIGGGLDGRLADVAPCDPNAPCLRPFVELIIDNHGNTHLCCYDWRGRGTLGNVLSTDFATLARRWRDQLPKIAGRTMAADAPDVCRKCGYRWSLYQQHDEAIVNRARRFREALP